MDLGLLRWGMLACGALAVGCGGEWTPEDGPRSRPLAECAPARLPSTGDPRQDCVDRINQLRYECQGLPPLERWTEGEACADAHAQYDAEEGVAHAGFAEGICSPGGRAQNECPGWGSVDQAISGCLQMMWDEGPGDDFWEHGHYLNMTHPSHSRVACGFHTVADGDRAGEVWAVQNFN